MKVHRYNFARESRFAKSLYGDLPKPALRALGELIQRHQISVTSGQIPQRRLVRHPFRTFTLGRATPLCRDPFSSGLSF
jgi:hypothetical protein